MDRMGIQSLTGRGGVRQAGQARKALLALLGLAALAALTALAWRLATRRGEVEQLVDILCGEDLPDAAWAFEKLKEVCDEDLVDLVGHTDDARSTALHFLHFRAEGAAWSSFSPNPFSVSKVCDTALWARVGSILSNIRSDVPHRSAAEIRNVVDRWLASRVKSEADPRHAPAKPTPWYSLRGVRPPSRDPSLRRIASVGDTSALLQLLTGEDSPLAHWAYEVLKLLPDEDLDRVVPELRQSVETPIYALRADWPGGPVGAGQENISAAALISVALAARAGNKDLQKLLAGPSIFRPAPETIAKVESDWQAYRSAALAR